MAKKYVRSIQFTQSGEVYYIRDGQTKERVDNLAEVASTGSYNDLVNKLIAGAGVSIDENNVITKSDSYVHEQNEASTSWVVNHNLNRQPDIRVIDTANNIIEPDIQYNDMNTCTIEFKNPTKGKAYLN